MKQIRAVSSYKHWSLQLCATDVEFQSAVDIFILTCKDLFWISIDNRDIKLVSDGLSCLWEKSLDDINFQHGVSEKGRIWEKRLSKSKKFPTGSMKKGGQIVLLPFAVLWGCMLPASRFQSCCKNISNTDPMLQVLSSLRRLKALPVEASGSTGNGCFSKESVGMFVSNCSPKPKESIPLHWSKDVPGRN